MGLRLVGKSITMAMRSRRRFIAFTLMYTTLMIWMSLSLETFIENGATDQLVYAVLSTIILSVLYAWIIINYRKREIATLKCIGYTNSNIRTLIVGELVWVTMVSFFIVAEVLIHMVAGKTYFYTQNFPADVNTYISETEPLLGIPTIAIVLTMFLTSQIIGIVLMYNKILKLRPIVALRVLK